MAESQGDQFREFVKGQFRFEAEKEISHTSVCIAGTLWKIIKDLESGEPMDTSEIAEALRTELERTTPKGGDWWLPNTLNAQLAVTFRIVSQELFMAVLSGGKCSCGGAQVVSGANARRRKRVHSRIVRSASNASV